MTKLDFCRIYLGLDKLCFIRLDLLVKEQDEGCKIDQ